jgi:hypothetical protein
MRLASGFLILSILCGCGHASTRNLADLQQRPIQDFDEQDLDHYLTWISGQEPAGQQRVMMLARKTIGQPYHLGVLGEHPFELYDRDPLYCLSASDCVTFVEQTFAMSLSSGWNEFFQTLQRIRYKDGRIGILTRNHFTEADWNINNAWLLEDVTKAIAEGHVEKMNVRIDRRAFFDKLGVACDAPVQQVEDHYIATSRVRAICEHIQDADVIEFVRRCGSSVWIGHMGIAAKNKCGVTVIHSAEPAVREEDLISCLSCRPNFVGIKVLRPRFDGSRLSKP